MHYFTQKLKTLFTIAKHPYFGYLKVVTKSYLSPTVYYKLYKYAKQAPAGHAIDIGPAQGGTTIAIAQGYLASQKNSQIIHSIEKGHSSNALSNGGVSENERVLKANLTRFDVNQNVAVHMAYSHEAFAAGSEPTTLGLVCIDADGAIDRDFKLFYNNLLPNGVVVLDDYEDMVNRHGKKLLQATETKIQDFITHHRVESLAETTPLGKELLIFRLVNYMKNKGLLVESEIVGSNTWFGHKPENAPEFTDVHYQDMQVIRQEIEAEFWKMRKEIQTTS
jgi:predicted O-methyltransferase YrrM